MIQWNFTLIFISYSGITEEVWELCKKENPDPSFYIPVPVVGSDELLERIKYQEQECKQHEMRLKLMSEEMAELQQQQITTIAKISEYRRKLNDLSHRALKVIIFVLF
jgi:nuclear pore complex protein Nup54